MNTEWYVCCSRMHPERSEFMYDAGVRYNKQKEPTPRMQQAMELLYAAQPDAAQCTPGAWQHWGLNGVGEILIISDTTQQVFVAMDWGHK